MEGCFILIEESVKKRFWALVDKSDIDGCWLFKGTPALVYGTIKINKKQIKAHRVSYAIDNNIDYKDIPYEIKVCHKCDTPRCVNPKHLFLGTSKDNSQDMINKGRGFFNRPESKNLSPKGDKHWCHLRKDAQKGINNHNCKLSTQQIQEIRIRYNNKELSQEKLAKEYGIAQTTVSAIVRKLLWADL